MANQTNDANGHGLLILPLIPNPQWTETHGQHNVDIVAVHGLNGGRWSTWTKGNVMWLQDLLPSKLPQARIMTFGYNADVVNNFSTFGIRDHARKLLSLLRNERDSEETINRLLIFVCHSLGGILVKQALRFATNEASYHAIAKSTRGIVFMGTPHRGSDLAFWGNLLASIANAAFLHPKKDFINGLKNNSGDLMNISEDFRSIVEKYAIVSFYEENKVKGIGKEVVGKHSAILELPWEDPIPLEGNHMDICKFSGEGDERFKEVWKALTRMINSSPRNINDEEILCLTGISRFDPELRLSLIPKPLEGTFQWVLQHERFLEWLNTDVSPILLITGKPGCGKSVLSAFAWDSIKAMTDCIACNYFACQELEGLRSAADVYGGLLSHLLRQVPSLFHHILPAYHRNNNRWSTDELRYYLGKLTQIWPNKRIIFIIDALDECESSRAQLLSTIVQITTKAPQNKFLLFSRHEGDIISGLAGSVHLNLDVQPELRTDVEVFVNARVDTLMERRPGLQPLKAEIVDSLRKRADGMFLLVDFIVESLYTLRQTSRNRVRMALNSLPETLWDVYEKSLGRVESEEQPWVRRVLSWIMYAVKPLEVTKLACAAVLRPELESFDEMQDDIPMDFEGDLATSLGLLIEKQNGTVHLSHQTVKEFLVQGDRSEKLGSQKAIVSRSPKWYDITKRDASEELLLGCIRCLVIWVNWAGPGTVQPIDQSAEKQAVSQDPAVTKWLAMSELVTLLPYATLYLPDHARELDPDCRHGREELVSFLSTPRLCLSWQNIYWLLRDPEKRSLEHSPIHLACMLGLDLAVEDILKETPLADLPQFDFRTPLDVAAEAGKRRTAEILLDAGANMNANIKSVSYRSVLSTAAWFGQNDIIRLFLSRGVRIRSTVDEEDQTALEVAAEAGRESTVLLLLELGSEINPTPHTRMSALHAAARAGRIAMISLLLRQEAHLGNQDGAGNTPLHYAAAYDQSSAAEVLHYNGSDIEARNDEGLTPLLLAVSCLRQNATKKLLDLGADVGATDHNGLSALHHLFSTDHNGLSALHHLFRRNDTPYSGPKKSDRMAVTSLLLDNGLNLALKDQKGRYPADMAILCDDVGGLTFMMEKSRDFLTPDEFGRSALQRASLAGSLYVAKFLLSQDDIQLENQDGDGRTALHLAVLNGHVKILENLLESGANVNAQDKTGSTPLILACSSSDSRAELCVKPLLRAKVDTNLRDTKKKTAILAIPWPCRHLKIGLVDDLLRAGAVFAENEILEILRDGNEHVHQLLWNASHYGYDTVARSLLAKDMLGLQQKLDGLSWAVEYLSEGVTKMLVEFIPKEDLRRMFGEILASKTTPRYGNGPEQQIHFVLRQQNVDLDAQSDYGRTILSWAAEQGNEDLVRKLLERGASATLQDRESHSALWWAKSSGHENIVNILLKHSKDISPEAELACEEDDEKSS